jgi:micrococcal nuclease
MRMVVRLSFLLCAVLLVPACETQSSTSSGSADSQDQVRVVRVVDGDTIIVELDGREERVRYIGIDAPESVQPNAPVECFGREASAENARLVADKTVELERDVSDRDRFGRLLRYVYVRDGATRLFVNRELVARGYANAGTFPPDVRYNDELRAAEREAREAERGLWGAC